MSVKNKLSECKKNPKKQNSWFLSKLSNHLSNYTHIQHNNMNFLNVGSNIREKYSHKGKVFNLLTVDVNITFPSFWCWSKAEMSSLAHWTLSGLGENSSCTAWTCPGWITCLPSQKKRETRRERKGNIVMTTAGSGFKMQLN